MDNHIVISCSSQVQQKIFFILPCMPTTTHFITPLFTRIIPQHHQFYRNSCESVMSLDLGKQKHKIKDQDNEISISQDNFVKSKKTINCEKKIKVNEDYHPKKKCNKDKFKKVYEKDKERNILPNAMSKLFFFLKSITKSEHLLKRILQNNSDLARYITQQKFYIYHNLLKSKMGRFMTEESLKFLFILGDPEFSIFSLEEQLTIIKINAIMLKNFVKNHLYFHYLLSSLRTPKDKIQVYMNRYRKILQKAMQFLDQSKRSYDFTILGKTPQI